MKNSMHFLKSIRYFLLSFLLLFILFFIFSSKEKEPVVIENNTIEKPNIIYILADDLGYGELGIYGQEKIETPNIDALAKNGMLFTQHYSAAPVCAPARYMLLTGKHSGHAYIRGNDEWDERGDVWNYKEMELDEGLEGQKPLPKNTVMFPEKLQEKGYKTAAIGKWGLGAPNSNSIPTKMGFDFFYGYNCQRQAHNYYPLHLYKNEKRVLLDNDTLIPHQKLTKEQEKNYKGFLSKTYAPDLMYKEMISFIDRTNESPFFLYWATPLPHVALQSSNKWVDYYRNKFGEEKPYNGKYYFPNEYPRATYAAMISYLDENIGNLVKHLKDTNKYDNTLIIFTSDNGPSSTGGTDPEFFKGANPFSGEAGRGKGYLYEGGIRVPMIASWPNKIEPGTKNTLLSTHYDVAATLENLVGFKMPKSTDGLSFLPTLTGKGTQKEHEFLYWEFPESGGQVAIRVGNWKMVRLNLKNSNQATLELYDLDKDPKEQSNVAQVHPEVLRQMEIIFNTQHTTPNVENFIIPKLEEGLLADYNLN